MQRTISKPLIFVLLAVLACIFGVLSFRSKPTFIDDLLPQLFWLTVGIIATTFVLETILQHDQEVRRREEDAFAFRSFSGHMMRLLLRMSGTPCDLDDALMEATLFDKKRFASVMEQAAQSLTVTTNVQIDIYTQNYLDVSNGLRDLARNYIRLFSSNRQEMLRTYQVLQSLASRWNYRDGVTTAFQEYTQSLDPSNSERLKRESMTACQLQEIQEVLQDTGKYLVELARKAACHRGMPAP